MRLPALLSPATTSPTPARQRESAARQGYWGRVGLLALLATCVMLLAGCLQITGDVSVSRTDKVTGELNIAMNKELAAVAGIKSAADLQEQLNDQGAVAGGTKVTTSEDDENLIVTISGNLNDAGGMFKVSRDGDIQTFKVTNTQSQGSDSSGLAPQDAEKYQLKLTAHFAGTVTAVSGGHVKKVDAATVAFAGPIMEKWSSTATINLAEAPPAAAGGASGTESGRSLTRALLLAGSVVVGLLMLVVAVAATLLLLRHRRRRTAESSGPTGAAGAVGGINFSPAPYPGAVATPPAYQPAPPPPAYPSPGPVPGPPAPPPADGGQPDPQQG